MRTAILTLAVACAILLPRLAHAQKYVGGDISLLTAYEQAGVSFRDRDGKSVGNLLTYLQSEAVGWNAQRVRLFVDPSKASDEDRRSGVCQDLEYVAALGKRIKEAGQRLMIDFHYSDTWADPGKQFKPQSWTSATPEELADTVFRYTKRSLEYLTSHGATPDFIQTGNEISFGMLWPEGKVDAYHDANWTTLASYLKSAVRACREVCPAAGIIIHTEQAKNITTTVNYYDRINASGIDYDIIGLSYYPFWHGDLDNLDHLLTQLATRFPSKKVQIVETAYYYQYQPTDGITDFSGVWPVSPDGQAAFTRSLIDVLNRHDNVNALYWWFPEENGKGNSVIGSWINRGLWNNNTGRANPALYELKRFLPVAQGIAPVQRKDSNREGKKRFTLNGQSLNSAPHGSIYICGGKKFAVR